MKEDLYTTVSYESRGGSSDFKLFKFEVLKDFKLQTSDLTKFELWISYF